MKKLVSILLMLTCVFGLTACGSEVETMNYDEQMIINQAEFIYAEVSKDYSDEMLAKCDDYTIDELEVVSREAFDQSGSGVRVEGSVWIAGIKSFVDSEEFVGTVAPSGEGVEIDAREDEIIVTMPLDGSIHDADLEIIYDKNLHVTSITTNVIYSTGELMEKAGVNTLIGMGSVFIILILISFIIAGLEIVPKIQKAFEKKDKDKTLKDDSVNNAIAGIIEREEVSDDTELVAVIAAAIAASEGTSSTDGFVVRSIKRIK